MRFGALYLAAAVALAPGAASAQTVVPVAKVASVEQPAQVPALAPPASLGALAGKPVTRVAVELEGNVWDDVTVPRVAVPKPGDPLTPAAARAALDTVLRSGRFARGQVDAEADGGGARLVLRLVPRKLVARLDVDLHGARLDVDELLRDAGLSDGGEIVATEVGATERRIERTFAVHGYPAAKAELRMRDTEDPAHTLVLVDVVPGAPRVIGDRYFYVFGAPAEQVAPLEKAYSVGKGDRADGPALDEADHALASALHAAGWHRAEVVHDLAWVARPDGGGRVALRVRIDTGPRIVPRFEGNEHYDRDALMGALALETETDRSPTHLADKVRLFYQKRGFLDVEVSTELRGADRDPVELLVFHVDEHPRVRVVSREYPCLKLDAIKHLEAGGPRSPDEIGTQIDSYLEEELPGADLLVDPDPKGVSRTIGAGAQQVATGARPVPLDLRPDDTYVADTYERATLHVQELYRNEGFLHATVGPVQVVRARCDPRSPPGRCAPMPLPPTHADACTYDPGGLPLPPAPVDPALTCRPDPAHGVE